MRLKYVHPEDTLFVPPREWEHQVLVDFVKLFARERIASGFSRDVYAYGQNGEYVIKVEHQDHDHKLFQNATEWNLWEEVSEDPKLSRWFAPCINISPGACVLIQARTQPLPKSKKRLRVPAFMCDLKRDNFGLLNGNLVCHDYGTLRMYKQDLRKYKGYIPLEE